MRTCLVLACLGVASTVAAAPVAKANEDVDGDGVADAIELGDDGTLLIGGKPGGSLPIAPGVQRARLDVARYRNRTFIVVEATTTSASEGVIVMFDGKWREVARFPIGGVGLDADYGVELETLPNAIYRYEARSDIRRCDGKLAYLFPEGFDPDSRSFRIVVPPTMLEPNLPVLPARVESGTVAAPLLYRAHAASHQPSAADAGGLSIPKELDDGRPETAWSEGLGSDGRGQFFTFEPRAKGVKARQLRIISGRQTTPPQLKQSNRLRELGIVTAQGSWRVELPDAADALGTAFVVDLPEPIAGCITVVIASTYGAPTGTTYVSELEVFADGERTGGGDAMLARLVAEGKDGAVNAAAALGKRGATGAVAIDAELAKTTNAGARRRLVGALVKIKDPAATPTLVRAAMGGWVDDKDLLDVIAALGAAGQVQALRDLATKAALAIEPRIAAVDQLAPTAGGLDALLALAGDGPHELRHAVIERLALAPAATLAQAASTEADAKAAGDLWRALTRRARTQPAERPVALAAMLASLPTVVDYERRYRLVDGVAAHGDAAALRALDTLLRGLPPGAQASALRQVAIRGIATAPRPDAIAIVIALAEDPDPGVRLAALSALAGADTDPSSPWHTSGGPDGIDRVIINGLATDSWPEVRRRAATALGTRCQRPGPSTALLDAVGKDPDVHVRVDALVALVHCKAPGIRDLLARTWDDRKAPQDLRTTAVGLVVALGDPQLAATLVKKLATWRGQAIESAASVALAQSATAALAATNPPGAVQALIDALDDTAFPEIVSAAAMALGSLGRTCPPAAKAKLEKLARAEDQSAVAARRAAAQCGR